MTAVAEPPVAPRGAPTRGPLALAEGVELLGGVHGSGYKEGAALVRRADGQMVQLGQLMYALLECVDGKRDGTALAAAVSERLGRRVKQEHIVRLAEKLAAQGLLAGFEDQAPPRRNPLLALRWKVLVSNPKWTRRLTAPFAVLFSPWLMWPILAGFVAVFWFVLFHKGVASATAEALHSPGLLLLVFALAVVSAGFHELGHASACLYGGGTPGGMGAGLYLVWPAFYTDVTDSYRLPRRDRLRVDLGGLYFNAVVAVLTMGVWLLVRSDALLLLVALQVLQMVKQLSPVIRADGYHILADLTGVPDLYAQMGPTLRRLLPGQRRKPSALTGRARVLVTVWVLIMVPILLSLSLSAVVLLPRLMTSAWDTGRHIATAIPHDASHGQVLDLLAAVVRMLALALPVLGSVLVTRKILSTVTRKARGWSANSHPRQGIVLLATAGAVALAAWAWWPSGQYQPVRSTQGGTIGGLVHLVSAPAAVARPASAPSPAVARAHITPGTHLAIAMVPVGGATKTHPAFFVIPGHHGQTPAAILSTTAPPPPAGVPHAAAGSSVPGAPTAATAPTGNASNASPTAAAPSVPGSPSAAAASSAAPATAFPFRLPAAPGPNGTQAVATNTTNGGVKYDVAYSLVTVKGGAPVTETNSAFALAHCQACTTVAVSFQLVLIVGESKLIAPIDAAGSLNDACPACITTALADQMVVTLKSVPSDALVAELNRDLRQLGALPSLGADGTPANVSSTVGSVQQEITDQLNASGLLVQPISSTTTSSSATATASSSSLSSTATPGSAAPPPTTGSAPATTVGQPPQASTTTTTTTTSSASVSSAPAPSTTTTAPTTSSATAQSATASSTSG